MTQLVFLQLNELNFDYVERYIARGKLPNFAELFRNSPPVRTVSETEHHLANPWIQWPTVHTGLTYAEHGVFRLGDMVETDHEHIYEALERRGVKVAAMAAFNAKNNTKDAAFFVPDPWTRTPFKGSWSLKFVYDALVQVADDYANEKITFNSAMKLALGALDNGKLSSYPAYVADTIGYMLKNKRWARAIVCDRLLADAFITQCKRTKPGFATLFLNGSAHLQHHYLFSSQSYDGERANPQWHCKDGQDPLLEILNRYDEILVDLKKAMPEARMMVATGLRQNPHERETFYFRIDDHKSFLDRIGLDYKDTYRLMTEDFVVCFHNEEEAAAAERKLSEVRTTGMEDIFYVETGDSAVRTMAQYDRIFHIENRGDTLYLQLRPSSKRIPEDARVVSGNVIVDDFGKLVSFAQYKNTHHHGDGWFIDTGANDLPAEIPLTEIFPRILAAFGFGAERDKAVAA
ncbi:MAG: hypothetical protein AAGL49_06170 [Pseudomonadota bacterium]